MLQHFDEFVLMVPKPNSWEEVGLSESLCVWLAGTFRLKDLECLEA